MTRSTRCLPHDAWIYTRTPVTWAARPFAEYANCGVSLHCGSCWTLLPSDTMAYPVLSFRAPHQRIMPPSHLSASEQCPASILEGLLHCRASCLLWTNADPSVVSARARAGAAAECGKGGGMPECWRITELNWTQLQFFDIEASPGCREPISEGSGPRLDAEFSK